MTGQRDTGSARDEVVRQVRSALEFERRVNLHHYPLRIDYLAIVTLDGLAIDERQKKMVETGAWYVFGVNDVVSQLEVRT